MPSIETPRELLEKLVSFPTVSRDSNLDLIHWVAGWLEGHGVDSVIVERPDAPKASLYAGVGPDAPGGVVLSGHTDVVPIDGQDWSSDPFTVVEREGKLYGRGTCDMKGFDALALWALVQAKDSGLNRPLQIALSHDEEVGCEKVQPLIEALMASGLPRAQSVIVGEPSMMQVVTGHKGGTGFQIHARGHEVHSSLMHTGVSAIMEAARLIDWANEQNAANAAASPSEVAALFDPPWTTLHCGMITGGTAHNITAGDCTFGVDFRLIPDENVEDWVKQFLEQVRQVEAAMQAIHPEAGFTLDRYFDVPPLRPEVDGPAEALARRLTGDNATRVVSYGTEAGHFQDRGYSTVVCGPGDIAQAHQADEFLSLSQLQAGQAFMERLLAELRG